MSGLPVRSPTTPRGTRGYVVRCLDTGSSPAQSWYRGTGTAWGFCALEDARVFATAHEAERVQCGPAEVWSLALVRELVGEREGRA